MPRAALAVDPITFATAVVGEDLSPAQRTLLKAIYGLPLAGEEQAIFAQCTGRPAPDPPRPFYDVTVVAGRRGGKSSKIVGNVAAIEAVLGGHERQLARGEQAACLILAPTRDLATVTVRLIQGKFAAPLLRPLVRDEGVNGLRLKSGVGIEVETASKLAGRSRGGPLIVLEECAFFPSDEESAEPDVDIWAALLPITLTYPGARRLKVSTPYAQRGLLYEDWLRHWGRADSDTLVWVASTVTMNPAVDARRIAADLERDPIRFSAEYVVDPARPFREDVAGFLDDATLAAAVVPGAAGLPYDPGGQYTAGVDLAGGGADEHAAVIAQRAPEGAAVVALCGWGSKAPLELVLDEMVAFLTSYGLGSAWADRYAAGWPVEAFQRRGVVLQTCPQSTGETFIAFGAALRQQRVALPDHAKLLTQLRGLERRTTRDGRDTVDHRPGMHDDVAAATARAVVMALALPDWSTSSRPGIEVCRESSLSMYEMSNW